MANGSQQSANHDSQRPPESIEQGLRDLAHGKGPTLDKLVYETTPGIATLMACARRVLSDDLTDQEVARSVLQFIRQLIADLNPHVHTKWRPALQAAFRQGADFDDPDHDTLYARLETLTEWNPLIPDQIAAKRAWGRGVAHLAHLFEEKQDQIREEAPWARSGGPSGYQPFRVIRLVQTCFFTGKLVTKIVTERRVVATQEGVGVYYVRDYMQDEPGAVSEVEALLNCQRGETFPVDLGPGWVAKKVEMLLPHPLAKDEACTFATQVTRAGDVGPTTWWEIQVTSHGIDTLVMRLQFDPRFLPRRVWYLSPDDPDLGRLDAPPSSDRDVPLSSMGFVEQRFGRAEAVTKLGLAWQW